MRKTTLIKALALLLSFAMLMTGLPAPSIAESVATPTDTVIEQNEDIVIEDDTAVVEDEQPADLPIEDEPVTEPEVPTEDTEDAVFPEDDASSADTAGDNAVADSDPSEGIEEPAGDEFVTEDELDTPDAPVVEDDLIVEEESEIPVFFSVVSPSRFTGDETVRLGKESNNIGGIIVQKDGSSSTSIARHWVTVDGVEYTAFCIEASDASTSGRDGGLEPGSDAGLLWILNNVPDSSDEDYAIKQQAVWAYLGQSFSIQNLAAGSRCSMSTDQLRARLTEIVTNAQSATLSGSQELWIAYHLENRSYYQDMAFTVAEPTPTITPTPTPVPTPTPTPVPVTGTIQVVKRDADTGAALAGATFQLYDAAGYPVGSPVMTNSDGVVAWGNLPLGNYSVQEITAPEGYNCDNGFYSLTLTENNLFLTIEVVNSVVYGKIRIIKTDAGTQAVLAGAVFEVTDAYGTVVATLVTGADGTAESDWLPYGSYTVTETQAASGYINSGFSTIVNVTEHGQTHTISVENVSMQGGIRLTKTDAVTGSPISDAQFDIYDANGTLVGSMTTNENGVAMSANLPRGQYTVKEHALPTGYTGELVELTADVEPNAVTDLTATNTPVTSRIKIIKTDAVTGEVLAGAVFSVTDDAGYTVATITTGADGTAITDWLPYGRYTVSEVQAPDRYINSGFSTTISAEEDGKTYTITVENSPTQGGVRLTKTDSMTGTPIAGVEFGIYDMTGTLVASMTTDANGVATAPSLTKGSYTVREHDNPTGYIADLVELKAEVHSDATTELTVTNTPIQGKIRIVKKDALTGDLLSGAEFTITRISGIPAHNGAGDGEVVATITTDTNGVAESPLLTYGTYRIDETAAPTGYVNSGYSKEVSISEDNLQTIGVVVENEPMTGGLRLIKTDSLTGSPIEGVKFNIFQGDSLIATMTTDENGIATCDNLNRGTYIVKEDSLPEGYTGELVVLEAVVQPDTVTELHATNTKSMSRIRIIKKDALTGERLPGAEFTVTDEVGNVLAVITDENGEVTTDWLPYGVYTVRETMAPEHYVNSNWSERIAAYENGTTYTFEVSNVPTQGYIRLTKTDSLNGMPIAGVQFDIYDASGTLAGAMTTDENGVAVSPALTKGSYTVCEHENPTGYVAALAELPAVVHSDETTDLAVTNDPIQGKIRIVKKDQLTGDLLSGAEFTITRISGIPAHNGAGNGEVVAVITTNENGVAETPLLTYGTYQIEETVVPEHFMDNGFSVEVTISDDNLKTYEVVVENEPAKGWLRLTKTNSLDGHPIAGVTFNVYYYDDYGTGLACTMTTDENGVAVSPVLRKGRYLVQEEDEPVGYVHNLAELTAIVNPDETNELHVTNEPIQGVLRIRKLDELTGEALAGAEFTITRISGLPSHNGEGDGEVVAVITTDAHGIAVTPLLPYGLYKVEENKVPTHFVDNDFSTEMVINEENFCTYEIDVENEPTKGWLRLTKTDRENGNPIADVVFDVCFSYQNDDWHLYRAIPLTETLIKIETWYRGSSAGTFLFGYDLCLIDTTSGDTDFEWTDDEHTSFSITMKDEENKYEWKKETFVVFILENEDYTHFDVKSYLGKWEVGDGEVAVPASASDYKYDNYQDVQKDLEDAGFTNITTEILYDIVWGWTEEGEVKSVSIDGRTDYDKGEVFKKDAPIVITYHMKEEDDPNKPVETEPEESETTTPTPEETEKPTEPDEPESEYEKAYIRDMSNYDLYYMFDTDTKTVVYFGTNDTYIERGTYTGDFSTGVTITWSHGEWTEKFTHKSGSYATLIDGNGWDWEYKVCDVGTAQRILDGLQ